MTWSLRDDFKKLNAAIRSEPANFAKLALSLHLFALHPVNNQEYCLQIGKKRR
jgi:hypothetical protein